MVKEPHPARSLGRELGPKLKIRVSYFVNWSQPSHPSPKSFGTFEMPKKNVPLFQEALRKHFEKQGLDTNKLSFAFAEQQRGNGSGASAYGLNEGKHLAEFAKGVNEKQLLKAPIKST